MWPFPEAVAVCSAGSWALVPPHRAETVGVSSVWSGPAPTIPLCALIFSSVLSVGAELLPAPRKQGVVGWAWTLEPAWALTLALPWELCDPGCFSQWLAVFRGHGDYCAHLLRSKGLVLGHVL